MNTFPARIPRSCQRLGRYVRSRGRQSQDHVLFHDCRCSHGTFTLQCLQVFARYTPLVHVFRCSRGTCHSSMLTGLVYARYTLLFHDCRCSRGTCHSSMMEVFARHLSFFHACRCSRGTCHSSILTGVRAGHVILPCVQMFARYTPLFHACWSSRDTRHSSVIAGVHAGTVALP